MEGGPCAEVVDELIDTTARNNIYRISYFKPWSVTLTVVNIIDQDVPGVLVSIPLPSDRVFRNQAMDDILALLYRNPHDAFGVRELPSYSHRYLIDALFRCPQA